MDFAANLINGRTPAEEFGQTSITVNRNYLDLIHFCGIIVGRVYEV